MDFAGALIGDPFGIPIRSGGSGGTATATADGFYGCGVQGHGFGFSLVIFDFDSAPRLGACCKRSLRKCALLFFQGETVHGHTLA